MKKMKTFELETYALYPVKLRLKAANKRDAIKMLENKDLWNDIDQIHSIEDWRFDTWYSENIKEIETKDKPSDLTKEELYNIYKDSEGLD